MVEFTRTRARVLASAAAFALAVILPQSATAKVISKKPKLTTDITLAMVMPSFAAEPLAAIRPSRPSGPARYFTINAVLAKRNAAIQPIQTAALADAPVEMIASADDIETAIAAQASATQPTNNDPFGMITFRAPDGLLWTKWRRLDADMQVETSLLEACRTDDQSCSPASRRFIKLIDAARGLTGRARIETVNERLNAAIRYTTDIGQHGEADRWTAPVATLAAGAGDCEDYAFAKYLALREAGIAAADLKVLLVRDSSVGQDHAVLAVRTEQQWLVLDNRWDGLRQTAELPRFMPLFAVDHQGVKLFAAPYLAQAPATDGNVAMTPAAADWGNVSESGVGGLPVLL